MKMFRRGISTDYKGRCGNCHKLIGEDSYCRYCGTKAGEGDFKPYSNIPMCIYGPPPITRYHKCVSCGYEWSTNEMIDYQKYCPKCGSSAPANETNPNSSSKDEELVLTIDN